MATTVRQLLNRVLVNLGETQVDDSVLELTEDYHILLLGFINTIKEEVENAGPWRALQTTDTVSVLATVTSTLISWANERSVPVRIHEPTAGQEIALVFDITDPAAPFPLQEYQLPYLTYERVLNANLANTMPTGFALRNGPGDELFLETNVPCSGVRTVQLTLVVPQARLEQSALDVEISIPATVIELGSTWYAFEERGEELGTSPLFSEQRYRTALDDALARDVSEQGGLDLVPT